MTHMTHLYQTFVGLRSAWHSCRPNNCMLASKALGCTDLRVSQPMHSVTGATQLSLVTIRQCKAPLPAGHVDDFRSGCSCTRRILGRSRFQLQQPLVLQTSDTPRELLNLVFDDLHGHVLHCSQTLSIHWRTARLCRGLTCQAAHSAVCEPAGMDDKSHRTAHSGRRAALQSSACTANLDGLAADKSTCARPVACQP
jgi:hypothetical protein